MKRLSLPQLCRALCVPPGRAPRLSRRDPRATHGWEEEEAREAHRELTERLDALQQRLWAEARQSLLLVFQAMDAGGKDGAIRNLGRAFDPRGLCIASFKVPSEEERAHDFLWRIHRRVPARGEIGLFNRSHYEDVLVVRVDGLVPRAVWRGRYEHIRGFEALLCSTGTRVLKFFLHISRKEQLERLRARAEDPEKQWKFSPDDLAKSKKWRAYHDAYEEALKHTSTSESPWFVVPADRKWFRDLCVASVVHRALEEMAPKFPKLGYDPAAIRFD